MSIPEQPKAKPERRQVCAYCGDDLGPWGRYSDRNDACSKRECQAWELDQAQAEREEAHERLDNDLGYGRW